jgi:MtN3 and saliva related transmembrane protein
LTLLGLAPACCTTVAFVPEVVKVRKSQSTAGISLGTFLILCIGIVLWLVYGGILADVPLIVANIVTLVLAGSSCC